MMMMMIKTDHQQQTTQEASQIINMCVSLGVSRIHARCLQASRVRMPFRSPTGERHRTRGQLSHGVHGRGQE